MPTNCSVYWGEVSQKVNLMLLFLLIFQIQNKYDIIDNKFQIQEKYKTTKEVAHT